MTAQHTCLRCGHESRCSRRGWADRHPAAAVTAGLFSLTLMSMMFSEHPVAAAAVTAVAGAGAALWAFNRERDRRGAVAARADHEYRALMAAALPSLPSLTAPARKPPARPHNSTPWQHISLLRTEPLRTARN
jgi:hypothetical protein